MYALIVLINSSSTDVAFGVSQGSVLGPLSLYYLLCTSLLGDIIRQLGMEFHLYADVSQIYFSFDLSSCCLSAVVSRIQACSSDISSWMLLNKLKLNSDRTDFWSLDPNLDILCSFHLLHFKYAWNIGVTFDSVLNFSFECHFTDICKSCYSNIRNIYRIRKICLPRIRWF